VRAKTSLYFGRSLTEATKNSGKRPLPLGYAKEDVYYCSESIALGNCEGRSQGKLWLLKLLPSNTSRYF